MIKQKQTDRRMLYKNLINKRSREKKERLRGNEHAGYPEQLKSLFFNVNFREIPINKSDR